MKCTTCNRTIAQIKALYHNKHEWLWTSPFTHKIVCADCLIAEYQQRKIDIPDNSLTAINKERTP